ncbi:MAG: class I SAM-dependent methyltransferase [Spirochaetota bacterium]
MQNYYVEYMYDPIAHYYEEIFPVSENQIRFVLSSLRDAGAVRPERYNGGGAAAAGAPLRLLDVGCAVGDLAAAVTQAGGSTDRDAGRTAIAPGIEVVAIDLSSAMIQRAAARHSESVRTGRLHFQRMDMLKIAEEFEPESFDAIACLGNTLVHQPGPLEIERFLKAASRILRSASTGSRTPGRQGGTSGPASTPDSAAARSPGGILVLQLLNYDYLLQKRPKQLPLTETEHVRFEREYSYTTGSGTGSKDIRVVFTTRLRIKSTGEVYEDSIELYPLRRTELETLLKSAGFGRMRFYGGFDGSPLEPDSFPLVVVAAPQQ